MPKTCFACSRRFIKGDSTSFHILPKEPALRAKWIQIIGKTPPYWKYSYLCSEHFKPEDFRMYPSGKKKGLRPYALPIPVSLKKPLSNKPLKSVVLGTVSNDTVEQNGEEIIHVIVEPSENDHNYSLPDGTEIMEPEICLDIKDDKDEVKIHQNIKVKRRPEGFIGDPNVTQFGRKFMTAKETVFKQRKKIKMLSQTVRRLNVKVTKMKSMMECFKNYVSEDGKLKLEESLSPQGLAVFKCFLNGPNKQQYSEEVRSFAITLHCCSPMAYEFVRATFNNALPHPSSIQKWCKKEPDFSDGEQFHDFEDLEMRDEND